MIKSYKLKGYKGLYSPLYLHMIEQVHLLICGTTGSGKSYLLHNLIHTSLIMKPAAQYIMIDVKRVELSRYRAIPQCIYYASEPVQVIHVLRYTLSIIEQRYKRMVKAGETLYTGNEIYLIIDELADIMTTQKKACMPLIQRICQIGRAAKVHCIACTQTPIAAVIPTQIKVNFDARIGLRTRSKQDSRNIIEMTGCEQLPRYGYAYYMAPGYGITLIHLPAYDETEKQKVIAHYASQKRR